MMWLTPRTVSPISLVMAGHGLESIMLAVVMNAGVTRGRKGAAAVLLIYTATATIVNGHFRSIEALDTSFYLHVMLSIFLMGYTSVVSHQANPFVSDETVLKIIGPGLTEEQVQKYAERIRTRQRWEAIGRRTRSLSHDANNLLMPIMAMGDFLGERLGDDAEVLECISDFEAAVTQLHALHRRMNPQDTRHNSSDSITVLQHVVNEVLSLLSGTAPEGNRHSA